MLISEKDWAEIRKNSGSDFEALRGQRIFLTGATGFFGKWLLNAFTRANTELNLGMEILALSRDPEKFGQTYPDLHGKAGDKKGIRWVKGSLESFDQPEGRWPWLLHAATPTDLRLYQSDPVKMVRDALNGTDRVLRFVEQANCERVLFTSSGAVYGRFPKGMIHVPESHRGAPQPGEPNSSYGEAKRMAEAWFALQSQARGYDLLIARCFAFVGPYLPWDWHFAVGNFLRDAMGTQQIQIGGDGTPYRSYLYGTDLVSWLLRIWTKGKTLTPYHVGSDQHVSIQELATIIASRASSHWGRPPISVKIAKTPEKGAVPDSYVPDTKMTRSTLDLSVTVNLEDALDRTVEFATRSQERRGDL